MQPLLHADAELKDVDISLIQPSKAPKIFLASPYTLGDTAINVKIQHDVFDYLWERGLFPVMPLLAHYQHSYEPRAYTDWIMYALTQLSQCDALFRIPGGKSSGADNELNKAHEWGIPVFGYLPDLLENFDLPVPKVIPNFRKEYYKY